jgi:threonine/homoserine/homoserine lactone efflux protein
MTSWQALGVGIGLGLSAGITPGPLLGLVINETLCSGWRAGVLVALAPPVADLVVIALCFLVLTYLPTSVFPLLSIAGGLYILFLGWETLRTVPLSLHATTAGTQLVRQSFTKGIVVNLLNPHPYLFWLTVGGPLVAQSYRLSAFLPIVSFATGFYACLVGSKILLALLVHSGRARLEGRGYQLALAMTGGLLMLFGGSLIWSGMRELYLDNLVLVVYTGTLWNHGATLLM